MIVSLTGRARQENSVWLIGPHRLPPARPYEVLSVLTIGMASFINWATFCDRSLF